MMSSAAARMSSSKIESGPVVCRKLMDGPELLRGLLLDSIEFHRIPVWKVFRCENLVKMSGSFLLSFFGKLEVSASYVLQGKFHRCRNWSDHEAEEFNWVLEVGMGPGNFLRPPMV